MQAPKFAWRQILVHLISLAPFAWLVYDAVAGNLSVNPIQDVTHRTGKTALILLVASLWVTPVQIMTGWSSVVRWRRPLGLYAFLYAVLHFLTFIGLDYRFRLDFIVADVGTKRFIFVGLAALLVLIPLAFTSTKGWQKRLGKTWRKLHRLVYLAGLLVVVHYVWAVKADIREPLLWGATIGLSFLVRAPAARRFFVNRRRRQRAPSAAPSGHPQSNV
jgi:methionine sulfoxide reductase heme-binding subunit